MDASEKEPMPGDGQKVHHIKKNAWLSLTTNETPLRLTNLARRPVRTNAKIPSALSGFALGQILPRQRDAAQKGKVPHGRGGSKVV